MIVAVDAITDELKKTVRYLNMHSTPGVEVLALELGYTRDGDVEVLVPSSYGEEVAPPRQRRPEWNEEGLFEVLEQRPTAWPPSASCGHSSPNGKRDRPGAAATVPA